MVGAQVGGALWGTTLGHAGAALSVGGPTLFGVREGWTAAALIAGALLLFGSTFRRRATRRADVAKTGTSLSALVRRIRQRHVASRLRKAVRQGRIVPFYQPIVDLRTGVLAGFECLARWDDAVRGIVSPDLFIPLAERFGFLDELVVSLLSTACRDMRAWPGDLSLSINLAPIQLSHRELPEALLACLTGASFPPHRLIIEITETGSIEDFAAARSFVTVLKREGVQIALDDFGIGGSNLRHLAALPLDIVKIDRHFVAGLHLPENSEIVRAILHLAACFDLTVTAEGIEQPSQAQRLLSLGCGFGQGFLFSTPVPAREAARIARQARLPFPAAPDAHRLAGGSGGTMREPIA